MPREIVRLTPANKILTNAFLYYSNSAGSYIKNNYMDGSINYYGLHIKQEFTYISIDVIGTGSVRFTINHPDLDMSLPVMGAKTLKAGDVAYFEEKVWSLSIYFIEDSAVELTLKS